MKNNQDKFIELREKYPLFEFHDFVVEKDAKDLVMKFDFRVGEDIRFAPQMRLNAGVYARDVDVSELEGLVFHIGLIELIIYWKSVFMCLVWI